MSNTQKSVDAFVQSPLVTATTHVDVDSPNKKTPEIDIQKIRKLETWQLQVIDIKTIKIAEYVDLIYEIKKTAASTIQIDDAIDLYCECLKVC